MIATEALPSSLGDLIARLGRMSETGEREVGAEVGSVAVGHYTDPDHWQQEQSRLFHEWPIVAAHSAEIAPGAVLPFDALGVPMLLARSPDGRLRAFLNACRHRGMALLPEGAAATPCKALVCPYHGWTYELDGRLRHRLHAETFDGIDADGLNLVRLPCDESNGLVFVRRRAAAGEVAGTGFSAATHLRGLAAHLHWLGLAGMKVFRKVDQVHPANWKLTADAFLEGYHIRVLHRNTIYPFFADAYTVNLHAGPHQDSLVARRAAFERFEPPADRYALCKLATPTQFIFPNTFLIWHPDYVSLIGMYSPAPTSVRWVHTMLVPPERSGPEWTPHWEKTFALIEQTVFQREDIATAVAIQRNLSSGAATDLQFGRLEQEVLRFHRNVDDALAGRLRPVDPAS